MIGIVGGVGPLAGLDVFKKIIEETVVQKDQEHLPVLLMSYPHLIVDRTEYLLGKVDTKDLEKGERFELTMFTE